MQYIICPNNTYSEKAPLGLYEWDATHYCTAAALTPEEKLLFWVFEMMDTTAPVYDPVTHYLEEGTPVIADEVWTQVWELVPYTAEQADTNLNSYKTSYKNKVDSDTAGCYANALEGLNPEYFSAEADAKEYIASGYEEPAPDSVIALAEAINVTTAEAADLIVAGMNEYKTQQNAVRYNRLSTKAQLDASTTYAELTAIMEQWSVYISGAISTMSTIYSNL